MKENACQECGLPKSAWPHTVNHPAVKTRPEAHLFVDPTKLGVPTNRTGPKHRDFVIGDVAIWRYPHAENGKSPLRVQIVGFNTTPRGAKLYEFLNFEDEWDVNRYLSRWEDLTLVKWGDVR